MKVLVIGGTGLIGSAIAARLAREHSVIVASRSGGGANQVVFDIAHANEASWHRLLDGVEAVVNCAGIPAGCTRESTTAIHHTGLEGLFNACKQRNIRRVIHFSAIGIDRAAPTDFSRSKRAGDQALMRSDLDWIILRPSVVIGPTAYGASALMRGLAALSIVPVMPGSGRLQVVWLDDVAATVEHFLSPHAPAQQVIELAGPQAYTFEELVALLRAWMRWPRALAIRMPSFCAGAVYRLGDLVAMLGWRPPIRSTAQHEIVRGAVSHGGASQMPVLATSLTEALARNPASVQERWFARLYFVKPLTFAILALFWLSTAFVSLGPGWDYGVELMREGGVEGTAAALTVFAGALTDLFIGLAIAYRRTSRLGLYAAILISFAYAIIGTLLVPRLWADPLGPMLKIWPIIVLHLVALAIRGDR